MKVAFVSLGCAKNLVNTEQMMALVRSAGHEITAQPEGADAAVLNTCGFIDSAKSEAIQNILELAELKKEGKLGKLLVTGCLSLHVCSSDLLQIFGGYALLKAIAKR